MTFAPRELHALGGQLFAGVIIFPVHREMFRVYLKSLPTTYGSRSDTQTATQIIDYRVNARVNTAAQKIVRRCDPISLLINTFGIHLEPGCKSHEQIIHHRTVKSVHKQATVLLYF